MRKFDFLKGCKDRFVFYFLLYKLTKPVYTGSVAKNTQTIPRFVTKNTEIIPRFVTKKRKFAP
jgi:hypothetical protein